MTLPWMAERIQHRAIASLRPHASNARVHDATQLAQSSCNGARPERPLHRRQRAWQYSPRDRPMSTRSGKQ